MLRPGDALSPSGAGRRCSDFAETVDALGGAYLTAEDVGVTTRDMEVVAAGTPYVTGRPRRHGGSGDPSPWTAIGVEIAMRVRCEQRLRRGRPLRARVVVSGLGHVGCPPGERLRGGAVRRLVVADIDPRKRGVADRLGARWVDPDAALAVSADVFAPCALGGVLSHATIGRLPAPIVVGAANNQLADDAIAEDARARESALDARTSSPTRPASSTSRSSCGPRVLPRTARRPRARHRRHAADDLRRRHSGDPRRSRPRWSSPAAAWPRPTSARPRPRARSSARSAA